MSYYEQIKGLFISNEIYKNLKEVSNNDTMGILICKREKTIL